jgi:hypothetical protein
MVQFSMSQVKMKSHTERVIEGENAERQGGREVRRKRNRWEGRKEGR